MKYPVNHETGLPLHPREVGLEPSQLTPIEHHLNNHHMVWPRKLELGSLALRGLIHAEGMQVVMPKDQHNFGVHALHFLFDPPTPPTHTQAVDYLLEAFEAGEHFKVYDKDAHGYVRMPIKEEFIDAVLKEKHYGV